MYPAKPRDEILSGLAFSAYGNPDGFLSGSHGHGFT